MQKQGKTKKFLVISGLIGLSFLAVSCASEYQPQPRSIGKDPSELKRSPCACLKIETKPGLPEWMIS
ncbi:MAG: hypothetical protein IKD08_03225 [Alphaproteobacteria bacterium]|nr:hypothetical protein [Alphaproteobacteria bacterium]